MSNFLFNQFKSVTADCLLKMMFLIVESFHVCSFVVVVFFFIILPDFAPP